MTMTTSLTTLTTHTVSTTELILQGPERHGVRLALRDIGRGLLLWRLWIRLGWNDILQRYRRSLIGPFWLTISTGVMVLALGFVYSKIFQIRLDEFIPFLCVGLLVWGFISSIIVEAGSLFTGSESYIKQIRLPYSLYVYRFICSKLIIFAHTFVVYFGVIAYFWALPGWVSLLAIPGLLILTLNGALTSLYIGIVSARFRDIQQIVASFVQIIFFATPIMWKPELLKEHAYIATLNPFEHLIEIVRAPLLGNVPTTINYVVALLITALNALLGLALLARYRVRISYWI
jgi:lipopolysaccharide transport system permease protein